MHDKCKITSAAIRAQQYEYKELCYSQLLSCRFQLFEKDNNSWHDSVKMSVVAPDRSSSRSEGRQGKRTRLHISPFDPAILPAIIPPSVLPSATDISYHDLQTFPEAKYGFVSLPSSAAEKIQKKLHGSILKGSKMKVERARPKRQRVHEPTEEPSEKPASNRQKRRREEGVVSAVELPDGRQVQRGWTKPKASTVAKSSKDKGRPAQASSYTTKA